MGVARMACYAGLAALGLLVGAAGALVHPAWSPGGLVLALAAAAGLFWGGAHLTRTKSGAMVPAGGWLLAVLLMTTARPEGDFVFGTGTGSYLFLFGGVFVAVVCGTLVLPGPPPSAREPR